MIHTGLFRKITAQWASLHGAVRIFTILEQPRHMTKAISGKSVAAATYPRVSGDLEDQQLALQTLHSPPSRISKHLSA